eukprot:760669-Rhodomonas_salina.1
MPLPLPAYACAMGGTEFRRMVLRYGACAVLLRYGVWVSEERRILRKYGVCGTELACGWRMAAGVSRCCTR